MKKECPHCKKEIEYDKPQQLGGHITNCKENPKKKDNITKSNETRYNNLYDKYDITCLHCKKEYILELTENQYNGGRYTKCCSKECSHKYSNSFVDYTKLKESKCKNCNDIVYIKNNANPKYTLCDKCREKNIKNINYTQLKESKCNTCGDTIFIKNNSSHKHTLCNNCKPIKIKKCSACGQSQCKTKICKTWIKGRSKQFIKIGFDVNKIGTNDFNNEYNRVVELLKNDYITLSTIEIGKKYNINQQTINGILKDIGVKIRKFSESNKLAIKTGRLQLPEVPIYPYKSGYHTTWGGNKIWYRSSYELEYCKILDKSNIEYEVEGLRIEYFDTQQNENRTAIPDFYLPETNEIIEIKSNWTYDEQNMNDKIKKYKELGYSVKLILDKIEYIK